VLCVLLRPDTNSAADVIDVLYAFDAILDKLRGKCIKAFDLFEVLGCSQIKRVLLAPSTPR